MDKGKKSIIAGASILGGISLYYLVSRLRDKPSPPTYTCPYCGETFETYDLLLAHVEAEHPSQPPPTEFGNIWGYIKDTSLGARIAGASVYMDGIFETTSDANGMFTTGYVLWGPHTITVRADNYEDKTIKITTEAESTQLEILMDSVPVEPTDWTEGVTIRYIEVDPALLYLGNSVFIDVRIDYPTPVPETVHGTILVDGTKLSGDFPTTYAKVRFNYTPAAVGTFTVKALDKSAHFTVLQDVGDTYYCPFGGTRMPICTDIVIPDVEPFWTPGYNHPSGDLQWHGRSIFRLPSNPAVISKLNNAVPIAWDPGSAAVSTYVAHIDSESVTIMAVDYTCPEYWEGREELAKMIVPPSGWIRIPDEWRLEYVTTCPTCNGSGTVFFRRRDRTCRTCSGTGKAFVIDLLRGWRDWKKAIKWVAICGGGSCITHTYCPYCNTKIYGAPHVQGLSWNKLGLAIKLLSHIEERHPSHPLTEPAWF